MQEAPNNSDEKKPWYTLAEEQLDIDIREDDYRTKTFRYTKAELQRFKEEDEKYGQRQ